MRRGIGVPDDATLDLAAYEPLTDQCQGSDGRLNNP
jgi:hypothetical protein